MLTVQTNLFMNSKIKSINEQIAKDIKDIKSKINLPDIPKSEVDTNDNEI